MLHRAWFAGVLAILLPGLIGCCCTDRCVARPTIVGSAPVCCPPTNPCDRGAPGGTVVVPPPGSAVLAAPPAGVYGGNGHHH